VLSTIVVQWHARNVD